jgi:transposase-like protein
VSYIEFRRYPKLVVAVGDGALGFWAALRDAWPETLEQRDWCHKLFNVLTLFAFPAEHWKHLRTSNVIESPFATVRLRQRVTKGAGSRAKGLLMAFKLLDMAQQRWRKLDGAQLLPLVRAGVKFVDGIEQQEKRGTPPDHAGSIRDI